MIRENITLEIISKLTFLLKNLHNKNINFYVLPKHVKDFRGDRTRSYHYSALLLNKTQKSAREKKTNHPEIEK